MSLPSFDHGILGFYSACLWLIALVKQRSLFGSVYTSVESTEMIWALSAVTDERKRGIKCSDLVFLRSLFVFRNYTIID